MPNRSRQLFSNILAIIKFIRNNVKILDSFDRNCLMPTFSEAKPGGLALVKAQTLASSVCVDLRRDIIAGAYKPGEKLALHALSEKFQMGLSPIREALNRLSRDGLVDQRDLRGFYVAPLTEVDLDELIRARSWLNALGVRESIARGDSAWEESVVLAHHRLSRTPRWNEDATQVNWDWEVEHRVFHAALLSACGSRWITSYCEQLFDLADRYRQLARQAPSAQVRQESEHRLIMEACVARKADEAVALLTEHLERTAELCRSELRRIAAETSPRTRRQQRHAL
jgi:GntR family carbon starvation induced transcriptional regulator